MSRLVMKIGTQNYNIGESIKANRLVAELTQTELAASIGVTHAAISFWENNVNVSNIADCIKIDDVLNISLDELVGSNK